MKVSIVIPTFNEEKLLPHLLEDLRKQTFNDFEIIVADANSTDNTARIAREAGAIVTEGGLPAVGRNNGTKIARGDFLFFFDADVRVPVDFVEHAYHEFEEEFLDLATCEFIPLSDDPIDKLLHDLANLAVRLYQHIDPHAPGFCIFTSKRLFERVHGFDETLKLAEDHNFVKRASAFRPLRILDSTRIKVSTRRLDKEGRFQLTNTYIRVELYRLLKGEVRDDVFTYEFADFDHLRDSPRMLAKLQEVTEMALRLHHQFNDKVKHYGKPQMMTNEFKETLHALNTQLEKIKDQMKSIFRE